MAVTYDPRYQTWNNWASLMVEAYDSQNLEIPGKEDFWKGWAAGFVGIDRFARGSMPDPYGYDDWVDWALAVNNVLSVSR